MMILNICSIHLLILQEEKHLLLTFSDDYKAYKAQTPRYLNNGKLSRIYRGIYMGEKNFSS